MLANRKYYVFILLAGFISSVHSQTFSGKVIAVKDGDTIEMLVKSKTYKIRLFGIDCPERKQAYGTRARQFTTNLVFGKYVKAVKKSTDRYGRFVCEIYLQDSISLNEELVKNGYAWHFKKYSKDERLAEMEMQARENKLGLWADPNPIPPWEFRYLERK